MLLEGGPNVTSKNEERCKLHCRLRVLHHIRLTFTRKKRTFSVTKIANLSVWPELSEHRAVGRRLPLKLLGFLGDHSPEGHTQINAVETPLHEKRSLLDPACAGLILSKNGKIYGTSVSGRQEVARNFLILPSRTRAMLRQRSTFWFLALLLVGAQIHGGYYATQISGCL